MTVLEGWLGIVVIAGVCAGWSLFAGLLIRFWGYLQGRDVEALAQKIREENQ